VELTVKVLRKCAEAEGIAAFALGTIDGAELPPFDAGAHIDVHTPAGCVRQYSLCNAPGERSFYQIAVLQEPSGRGGSLAMHGLEPGSSLRIGTPRNHFPLVESAPRSVLFAGGVGITPLLAMAERLHALGRDFVLHYATRSMARMAFIERVRASDFTDKVRLYHSEGSPENRLDIAQAMAAEMTDSHIYVCGPQGFLNAVRATAADTGWPESHIHFEYFVGVEAHAPGDRHFDVVIHSTGQVIRIEAAQTVTDALHACGVDVQTSCEQGVCGTCLTRVLEGEIDHKDLFLSPEEQAANDQFLPCCSRAKSARIVLDL
jgi:vanillate O-demethylase ferredoxin subunit